MHGIVFGFQERSALYTLENFLPQICQYKTFYCSALKKNATFWNFLFLKYESICYSLL